MMSLESRLLYELCINGYPHEAETAEDDEIKDIKSTPHRHRHRPKPSHASLTPVQLG